AEAQPRPRTIIDCQVHAYEANTPQRPWFRVPNWPPHVTGDEMVLAMDMVGVDGAIFVSPFSMYQYDGSYAVEVQKAHPGRFALVKPVNPDDPAVTDVIADWKKTPGTVGIRIIMTKDAKREPTLKGYHLLPSVRGDLLHKLGRYQEAHAAFEAAAALAGNGREHDLLRRRAAEAADAAMSS
ncbi:MAG: L-fuconolactonase, partial [Bradyrhizobium sp.]|nr:L-fuconolactonase [Bradyrhizobium sp.]